MSVQNKIKFQSFMEFWQHLPNEERIIVDALREIILKTLPSTCKEKHSFNVPYFYNKRGICIIWPSAVPRGGIKSGVLLGFWYGCKLQDVDNYLTHGTNKQIFYKIYYTPEEINEKAIKKLLKEAVAFDALGTKIVFKPRRH